MNFHVLLIINLVFIVKCQEIRINPYNLHHYDDTSYIIDARNITGKFKLSCFCTSCSNLRFTFSNDFHNFSNQVSFNCCFFF